MRAQTWGTVIAAAGDDPDPMEVIDELPVSGGKGDMGACSQSIALTDPEESLLANTVTRKSFAFGIKAFYAYGAQYCVVEDLRSLDIANPDRHMIKHITLQSAVELY
ncbi:MULTISPECIES: hypothetical protein [Rhizobium]|uniref:hypothetical protein n=1 Tax=Rhizobium TaxID=379 RepID=UPI00084C5CE4|nr:hypothetical protein A9Z06_21295 [Rhizobium sp. YK2]